MSANTDVDIPSAAPSESVAIATNPGARRSERLVCGIAAAVARRKPNVPLTRSLILLTLASGGVSVRRYSASPRAPRQAPPAPFRLPLEIGIVSDGATA